MKQAKKPFSILSEKVLQKYGKQKNITIITHKNNFAHGLICKDCGTIPYCKQCDVAIAYYQDHHKHYFGLCSYCKSQYPSPDCCTSCHGHNLDFYGYGAQQIKELLYTRYQLDGYIYESKQLNSLNKLERHSNHDLCNINISIGTNLLIHPKKETDILILIHADQRLQFPDYNSRWNNFVFLYEAIMKHPGKHIILQSYHCEDLLMILACKGNLQQAQKEELQHRNILSYPPYVDMCLLLYKDEIEEKLFSSIHKLHKEILYLQEKNQRKDISIIATPPLVYKLHGKFRYSILCKGHNLRPFIHEIYEKLEVKKRGFMLDRMPMNTI